MSKEVKITEDIAHKIRVALHDAEAPMNNLIVFEALAIVNKPITQLGTFKGGVFTKDVLQAMANKLGHDTIPLQIMHDAGMLAVGKVFSGQVLDRPDGFSELRVLFFMNRDNPAVQTILDGITDEVSINVVTKQALCSKCSFDFYAQEDPYALLYGQCDNGHTLGVDGCHLKLDGLQQWGELSLVNKGGSQGAKILAKHARKLTSEHLSNSLDNSSNLMGGIQLTYNTKKAFSYKEIKPVNENILKLSEAHAETKVKLALSEKELTETKSSLTKLNETVDTLQSKIDSLEAETGVELKEVKEQHAEITEKLSALAEKSFIQLGKDADIEGKTPLELFEVITENTTSLVDSLKLQDSEAKEAAEAKVTTDEKIAKALAFKGE